MAKDVRLILGGANKISHFTFLQGVLEVYEIEAGRIQLMSKSELSSLRICCKRSARRRTSMSLSTAVHLLPALSVLLYSDNMCFPNIAKALPHAQSQNCIVRHSI